MFDAHKLDLSEEFREVIDVVAKHGDKVICFFCGPLLAVDRLQ